MFGAKNDSYEFTNLEDQSERGARSDVEREIRTAELAPCASRAWYRFPWWGWAFAFVVLGGGYFASKYAAPNDVPDCDTERVRQKVAELANQQSQALTEPMLGLMLSAVAEGLVAGVLSVTDGRTLFHDEDSGFRACVASAAIGSERAPIGFTIEWQDKEKGEYLVQLSNAAALEARYGTAAPGVSSSAALDTANTAVPRTARSAYAAARAAQASDSP